MSTEQIDYALREEFDKDVKSTALKLLVYASSLKTNQVRKPPVDSMKDVLEAYIEMGVRDLQTKQVNKTRAKTLAKAVFNNRLKHIMDKINS